MEQNRSRLWTPDFCRLITANLLLMISANLMTGMFSLYLVSRGATDLHIGIASYLFMGASLVIRPLAGWHLDHRSRKTLVVIGVVALVFIPWGYVVVGQILMVIVVRFLHGVAFSLASTGVTTSAYDALAPEVFSQGVGYFGFSNAIATAFAPAVGLWLWNQYEAVGVFGTICVAMAVAMFLLRGIHFREISPEKKALRLRDESFADLIYEKDALPASILEGLIAIGSGTIGPYLTLYMIERGDILNPGFFYTCQACGTFVSRMFVGRISDRHGEAPLVYSSTGLFMSAMLLLIFGNQPYMVFLAAVLMGVGYGFTVTGFQIMSVRIVPPERRGSAASTYSCGWDVFCSFGGLLGGILATFLPYRAMFALVLMVYPVMLLSYIFVISKHPSAFKNYKKAQQAIQQ